MAGFNVSYIIEAVDKFSAVSKKISDSLDGVQRKAKETSKSIDDIGKKFKKVGGDLRYFSAASVGIIGASIMAWNEEAQAIAQVETGIKSTHGAAKLAVSELTAAASKLQGVTLFQDDEILAGVTSQLLTFTNLAGDNFLRAQESALDLATRLKIDLKSASIQLGKALNDPIRGINSLARSGIQFSEKQRAVIKSLVEAGRVADAQKIILKELETQFGGSARAAALAGAGGFVIMKNAIADASEDIGQIIGTALIPLAQKITQIAQSFKNSSPFVKNLVAILFVLVAVIAPVLAGIGLLLSGLSALVTVGGAVAGVLAGITLPFVLWAAAIAGVVLALLWLWSNWNDVSSAIGDTIETVVGWFSTMVEAIKGFFVDLGKFAVKLFSYTPLGLMLKAAGLFQGSQSSATVDINLSDPGKAVESVQTSSRDSGVSFNFGQNMAEAG